MKNESPITALGVNTGHDGGCCLIHKDMMVGISEERLNRKKHSDGYLYSIEYCLSSLNLTISDIDKVFFSSYHKELGKNYSGKLNYLNIPSQKIENIDHHLSHAYNTYYFSGFDEALIVIIDGLGNNTDTESYYIGKGSSITKIGGNDPQRDIFRGIGRAYESFTNLLGWPATDAGKTMGLAPYGGFYGESIKLFQIDDNLRISADLDGRYEDGAISFVNFNNLKNLLSLRGKKGEGADIASFIQYQLEDVIIDLIKKLVKQYGIRKLCLGGGVALNGPTNQRLLDEGIVDEIYIPSSPCDTGECVGNLLAGLAKHGVNIQQKVDQPYFGREYSQEEVEDVLQKKQYIFSLPYEVKKSAFEINIFENENQLFEEIGKYIKNNQIVGRFQGGSELGPRALGHRSILANPLGDNIKSHINEKVKHREPFRPFAASICYEDAHRYFSINQESPFMMFVHHIKEEYRKLFPAVTHIDGTCRLQTVTRESDERYYKLLKYMENIIGYPMLLNTSFNDNNEPIVENPRDAIRHLALEYIDVLVIGNYLITKK